MYKLARFSYESRSFSRYLQSIAKEKFCDFRYEFIEKQTVKVRNFRKKYYKMNKTLHILKFIKVDIFGQLLCNFMPMQIMAHCMPNCTVWWSWAWACSSSWTASAACLSSAHSMHDTECIQRSTTRYYDFFCDRQNNIQMKHSTFIP